MMLAISIGIFFLIIEPDVILFRSDMLDLEKLTSRSRQVTVLDINGNPIDNAVFDNNRINIQIDDLHDYTVNAFIAIEDKRFYNHNGVDYKRMVSALISNVKNRGFREGASTITQQLIKNTHLSNEKTIRRKISEIRLARKLERIYDKQSILQSYFNILYFGSGIRGLGTASIVMFDKPASELSIAQSAALASIINNPSKYSPYYNENNLTGRKELVLRQMLEQNYITRSEFDAAINEPLVFGKNKQMQYISGALKETCKRLKCTERALFINNCTIRTSYDPDISEYARNIIKTVDENISARVLVLDNKSGGIVCDETNEDKFIDPRRSPASTIKPFLSYAPALENGMNPLSQIVDEPTVFGDYAPGNFRDIYRGYMSMKDCLIYSSNIAAVKLLQQNGVSKCKAVAQAFGIPFEKSDTSLSIALGGMEKGVTLTELANAYRTLACGGMYSDTHYIDSVTYDTGVSFDTIHTVKQAVGDDTAYLLTDMLMQCAKTGTAKKLKYSGIIAAKTGTNGDSEGNRDCYCIAYTPLNTIAVWLGAKAGVMPNNITGAYCCDIIGKLCANGLIKTDVEFEKPTSVSYFDIDGKALQEEHAVYLADPMLQGRYRRRVLLSKRNLPVRRNIDMIDYYDNYNWEDFFTETDDSTTD